MGCDYYILKLLRIYYNDAHYLEIELDRQKGYYDDQFDEDAEDYDDQLNKYIENILTVKMDPIIIYNQGQFKKTSCESKYKTLIENELKKYDKNWLDVTKIMKVEERRER
jgi:chromosomal replication initiation ATPase DnaA